MIEFKGSHFERDVILWAVRWYVAYPISYRQLEEMMEEHGVEVDHATLNRWVLKFVPLLEREFRAGKQPVGPSWRLVAATPGGRLASSSSPSSSGPTATSSTAPAHSGEVPQRPIWSAINAFCDGKLDGRAKCIRRARDRYGTELNSVLSGFRLAWRMQ